MSKFIRDYSRNSLVINLLGNDNHIDTAISDITNILQNKNLSYKVISLRPTTLSFQPDNKMPLWRVQIDKEMKSNEHIIINKIGRVNCDEITDLNRSIRALNKYRQPVALYVEPFPISKHNYLFEKCPQVSAIFPLNGTNETKIYEFETFLHSNMVEIKE